MLLPLSQGGGGGCRGDCALAGGVAGAGQCRLVSMPVAGGQLLATLPTWGPEYSLAFNLVIHSYDGPGLKQGRWAELLRFTTTQRDCCGIGDRLPALWTDKATGTVYVFTQLGEQGNWNKNFPLETKRCYSLELVQYEENVKVHMTYMTT